ncbi:hypothetical protein [Levyella massiliensis]|uniref:hypothetical protein n=1 Tax=Levyella massiliensis TaxID=938289 RepID=UPI0023F516D8|nr:hypothetical protein [Levyella massiliensis]
MIKITNRAQEVGGAPLEMALAARFSKSPAAGRLHIDTMVAEARFRPTTTITPGTNDGGGSAFSINCRHG